jgi:hypothetical protein
VPLPELGGIEAFIRREGLPYTPDAWIEPRAAASGDRARPAERFARGQFCCRCADQNAGENTPHSARADPDLPPNRFEAPPPLLLRLQADRFDESAPFRNFRGDVIAKLLRRTPFSFGALLGKNTLYL